MYRKSCYLLFALFFMYGCNPSGSNSIPYNRPDDLVIEYVDAVNQKTYYISKDSSFCIFTMDSITKRVDMDFTDEALEKLYNSFTANNFDMIDTLNMPFANVTEDNKKPFQSIKVSWGNNSLEKSKSAVLGIKPFWEEKYEKITGAIVLASQDMMDKSKKDFNVFLDESLQNKSNFITIDVNTVLSIDPLDSVFYYNSNEKGIKDTLQYRLLDGVNRFAVFYSRLHPSPGEGFMIANNTFDVNLTESVKGLKLSLEGDSIKWSPVTTGM